MRSLRESGLLLPSFRSQCEINGFTKPRMPDQGNAQPCGAIVEFVKQFIQSLLEEVSAEQRLCLLRRRAEALASAAKVLR